MPARCLILFLAATVMVTWWANPEPDIFGYRLWVGSAVIEVGKTTNWILTVPENQLCRVAVGAVNYQGLESEQSEAILFFVGAPRFSTNLIDWSERLPRALYHLDKPGFWKLER
jgi:hypothetical protein